MSFPYSPARSGWTKQKAPDSEVSTRSAESACLWLTLKSTSGHLLSKRCTCDSFHQIRGCTKSFEDEWRENDTDYWKDSNFHITAVVVHRLSKQHNAGSGLGVPALPGGSYSVDWINYHFVFMIKQEFTLAVLWLAITNKQTQTSTQGRYLETFRVNTKCK